MSKQSIVGLVILIIIAGAVFLLGNTSQAPTTAPSQSQPTPEEEATSQAPAPQLPETKTVQPDEATAQPTIVRYTPAGFEPAQVTIRQGETVRFINESGREMWVASDIHPTHTLYSGTNLSQHCGQGAGNEAFDQCQAADTYQFQFNQVGEWGYHNHRQASHTGKVIVIE